MDNTKAKKAVQKAGQQKQLAAALAMQAAAQGGMDPEIQVPQATMQPVDGYVNPYHAMGSMAPTMYSAGNILDGYNYPQMVNPET